MIVIIDERILDFVDGYYQVADGAIIKEWHYCIDQNGERELDVDDFRIGEEVFL